MSTNTVTNKLHMYNIKTKYMWQLAPIKMTIKTHSLVFKKAKYNDNVDILVSRTEFTENILI